MKNFDMWTEKNENGRFCIYFSFAGGVYKKPFSFATKAAALHYVKKACKGVL